MKKVEKGVDFCAAGMYNTSSRREQDTIKDLERSDMILENDTETRRTRNCDFHESQFTKTVNS